MGQASIEPFIGRDLADNVGAFARRKKPAHGLPHFRTSTVSTAKRILISIDYEGYNHEQPAEEGFDSILDLGER